MCCDIFIRCDETFDIDIKLYFRYTGTCFRYNRTSLFREFALMVCYHLYYVFSTRVKMKLNFFPGVKFFQMGRILIFFPENVKFRK